MSANKTRYIPAGPDIGSDVIYMASDGRIYRIKAEKYDEVMIQMSLKLDAMVGQIGLQVGDGFENLYPGTEKA